MVSGYGVMTRGVLAHLGRHDGMSVGLLSRHQRTTPCAGVECLAIEDLPEFSPDVILGCFEGDERSREFWGSSRVRGAVAARGAACIEMSTLSPRWVTEWHSLVESSGGVSVESPVTGSRSRAENGTLSAFVYASADDLRANDVLGTFVRKRYDFNVPGHPTRFKLIYNAWGAAILHSMGSFVPVLIDLLDEDFEVAIQILKNDGWMALVCSSKLDRMLEEKYGDPDFALRHMVKDLRYAEAVIVEPDELFRVVHEAFVGAQERHGGSADYTAVTYHRQS